MDIVKTLQSLVDSVDNFSKSPEVDEFLESCKTIKKKITDGEIKIIDTREKDNTKL
jgi:hypothetical protein